MELLCTLFATIDFGGKINSSDLYTGFSLTPPSATYLLQMFVFIATLDFLIKHKCLYYWRYECILSARLIRKKTKHSTLC